MLRLTSLALASCSIVFAACGEAEPRTSNRAGLALPALTQQPAQERGPGSIADAFMRAIDAGEQDTWEALLTAAAIGELQREGSAGMQFNGENIDAWTVGEETVAGAEAGVAVRVEHAGDEQAFTLKLRREGAEWRVCGMALPMGDGEWELSFEGEDDAVSELGEVLAETLAEGLTEAFEGALTEWEAGGSTSEIAAGRATFEVLSEIDEAQHDAVWKIDVAAAGRPALEVLHEVLGEPGFPMQARDLFEHASSLELSGVSRLEALEALCVEAGVVPLFPDASSAWNDEPIELTFRPGERARPVAFSGPFMAEASAVDEHVPHTTGELTITVRALGLAPAVLAANQDMTSFLDLEGVQSEHGANLLADPDVSYMGSPIVDHGLFEYSLTPELTGLLRSVESLSVQGRVSIHLPTEVHSGVFDDERTSERVTTGPWTVEWDDHGSYNQLSFRHADGETSGGSVRFAPTFSSGAPMGIQSESAYDVGTHLSASVATPETPAALGFKVFTPVELSYEFSLRDIALVQFAEQPARLEPLAYAGAAPLEVEFAGFGDRTDPNFPMVNVSISSRCNLQVTTASVTFEYLDHSGELLKDFQHNLTGEFTFEGTQPLALVDQSSQLETTAFFMPEETASIRVRVDSVKFVNGTTWERE